MDPLDIYSYLDSNDSIFTLEVANTIVNFNILNNKLTFKPLNKQIDIDRAFELLFEAYLHIEIYCDCKSNYYLSSFAFDYIPTKSKSIYNIKVPDLLMESFSLDPYWIQNHYVNNYTSIFSLEDPEIKPIRLSLLNFDLMSPEQIINTVKLCVSFA
jgi:hypothetical protein